MNDETRCIDLFNDEDEIRAIFEGSDEEEENRQLRLDWFKHNVHLDEYRIKLLEKLNYDELGTLRCMLWSFAGLM